MKKPMKIITGAQISIAVLISIIFILLIWDVIDGSDLIFKIQGTLGILLALLMIIVVIIHQSKK